MVHSMRILKGILVFSMVLCLTGCGNQAQKYHQYVKGNLDAVYLGEYTDYNQAMDTEDAEAEKIHEQSVDNYKGRFETLLGLYISTEEQAERLRNVVSKVCACAKYEVSEAYKESGDYFVDVVVYPMDYEVHVVSRCRELMEEASENLKAGIYGTEEEYQQAYTEHALDVMEEYADKIGYLEEEKFSLKIKFNNHSFYIDDDDFLEVSDYIFATPVE